MKMINYKDIKLNAYSVDENGNIYSHLRKKFLSQRPDKDGYMKVGLMQNNGKQNQFMVHALVANAYIGNPPIELNDPTVNHKDHIKSNNYYENLEWMSRTLNSSENNATQGEKCARSILTEKEVLEIRELFLTGLSHAKIGRMYNVHSSTIGYIINRITWKHI